MKNQAELIIATLFAGLLATIVISKKDDPTTKAEYCAEEMITREVIDGRLTEHRHCASWVGWPIQVVEVAK